MNVHVPFFGKCRNCRTTKRNRKWECFIVGKKVFSTLTALFWSGLKIQLDSHVEVSLSLLHCSSSDSDYVNKKNLHGVITSHHHESSALQRLSLSWNSNPGLYLAVIPNYKSDLPVFFNLPTAASASWRGRAAAGVLPTWAAPTPTGRSLETQKWPMRRDETERPFSWAQNWPWRFLQLTLHSIWNWLYFPQSQCLP